VLLSCAGVGEANRAQWCNEEFTDLINQAKSTSDQEQRAELYRQAQVIFKQEAPWATIAHSTVFMPMSTKVQGYIMSPLGSHQFDGVDITE
jgi:dipeptide transport system substrate-binding protein